MYLTRDLTSMSLVNIGQVFGGRDHTTVMHNCKTISEGMKDNPQIYTYACAGSRCASRDPAA